MAKAPRKFRWESAPRAFSCLRQPTSCEDAAANEGWQGRGLSLPAWEFLLCRERLMLLWAPAQGLFPFQSITGARADEEPVCHRRPQGEDPHPSPSHTQPLLTPFRSCWAPGEGELPWELDHSWITAFQPCQSLLHAPLLALHSSSGTNLFPSAWCSKKIPAHHLLSGSKGGLCCEQLCPTAWGERATPANIALDPPPRKEKWKHPPDSRGQWGVILCSHMWGIYSSFIYRNTHL